MFAIDEILVGLIMFVGAVALGIGAYKRFKSTEPKLIISNDGITSKQHGFHSWSNIRNEQVFCIGGGENSDYGLSYDVNGESFKIDLSSLTGSRSFKVDHVLRTYRGRYQIQHRTKP
jgi:hypothetical protein